MSNPFTDYIQDLYWMYVSAGYSEESAILLAEAEAQKEAGTWSYDNE
jgi:hypothetical protein